jgi:WD40 repeat protein
MGLIAHPGAVTDITSSFDGKYVFTSGGSDLTVNMWTVDTDALGQLLESLLLR